jgi:hypothetical protein
MRSKDKNNFHVGYFFDVGKGVNDLNKVVIKFPKKIIDHASCIKHIEVVGHVNNVGPATLSGQKTGQKSGPTYRSGLDKVMYPNHDHEAGWHGIVNWNQTRTKRNIFSRATTTTTTSTTTTTTKLTSTMTTSASTTAAKASATVASGSLTVYVSPPFLYDSITAVIEGVEPCKSYLFNLKVVSHQALVLAEISGLELLPLPEIDDFHPPSLSKLFVVDHSSSSPSIQIQSGKIFS